MGHDGGAGVAVALHELDGIDGQMGGEDAGELDRGRRGELGGLPHAHVSVGERGRELPGRDRDREVPRGDQPHDAARAATRHHERAAVRRRVGLPVGIECGGGVVAEDGGGAGDLAPGLGDRLADFAADERGERCGLSVNRGGHAHERIGSRLGDGAGPLRTRRGRSVHGAVDVDPTHGRHPDDDVIGLGRIRADDLRRCRSHYLLTYTASVSRARSTTKVTSAHHLDVDTLVILLHRSLPAASLLAGPPGRTPTGSYWYERALAPSHARGAMSPGRPTDRPP